MRTAAGVPFYEKAVLLNVMTLVKPMITLSPPVRMRSRMFDRYRGSPAAILSGCGNARIPVRSLSAEGPSFNFASVMSRRSLEPTRSARKVEFQFRRKSIASKASSAPTGIPAFYFFCRVSFPDRRWFSASDKGRGSDDRHSLPVRAGPSSCASRPPASKTASSRHQHRTVQKVITRGTLHHGDAVRCGYSRSSRRSWHAVGSRVSVARRIVRVAAMNSFNTSALSPVHTPIFRRIDFRYPVHIWIMPLPYYLTGQRGTGCAGMSGMLCVLQKRTSSAISSCSSGGLYA